MTNQKKRTLELEKVVRGLLRSVMAIREQTKKKHPGVFGVLEILKPAELARLLIVDPKALDGDDIFGNWHLGIEKTREMAKPVRASMVLRSRRAFVGRRFECPDGSVRTPSRLRRKDFAAAIDLLRKEDDLEETRRRLEAAKAEIGPIVCKPAAPEAVEELRQWTEKKLGGKLEPLSLAQERLRIYGPVSESQAKKIADGLRSMPAPVVVRALAVNKLSCPDRAVGACSMSTLWTRTVLRRYGAGEHRQSQCPTPPGP